MGGNGSISKLFDGAYVNTLEIHTSAAITKVFISARKALVLRSLVDVNIETNIPSNAYTPETAPAVYQ